MGFDETAHIDTDIFRYKGSYIGDNSAVVNIAYQVLLRINPSIP